MEAHQTGNEWQPIFGQRHRSETSFAVADPDYYAVLQVSSSADQEVIRAAYRSLARKYHPDQNQASSPARMRQINEAYEVLGDPLRRRTYDQSRIGRHVDLTDTVYQDHLRSAGAASGGRDYYIRQSHASSPSSGQCAEQTTSFRVRAERSYREKAGPNESRSEEDLTWVNRLALVSLIIVVIAVLGWGLATLPFGGSEFNRQSSSFLGSETILLVSLGIDAALAFAVLLAWWRRAGL